MSNLIDKFKFFSIQTLTNLNFFSALFKENKLSLDSFLLNHSTAYHLALTAGMVEYLIGYVNLEEDKFYPVSSL